MRNLFSGVVQFTPGQQKQGAGPGWGLYSECLSRVIRLCLL